MSIVQALRTILLLPCMLALLANFAAADDPLPADRSVGEAIDHYIDAGLQRDNLVAASKASDATVLRRTTLDLAGRIPSAAEARAYLDSTDPEKRRKMVERLLASGGYARQQANEFDVMLMYGEGSSLRDYLTGAFKENRPWDQMFREMVLGDKDDAKQEGAIRYVRAKAKDLDKLTNKASVDFFGVNISCARCHDHPEAPEWTQEHFFGMKSFFARTFENGGFVGEREYGLVQYKTTSGEQKTARLMFLTGQVLEEPEQKEPDGNAKKAERKKLDELKKKKQPPPAPGYSRRARLVEVGLQNAESDYFAKSIVNQVWNRLIGYGLVMPVDQMHPENPPSHPELMDWLARDLREHKFDLKRLIRGIVMSDTYARSTVWDSESPRPPAESFGVGVVRPLSPQQYSSSLKFASLRPDYFAGELSPEELEKKIEQIESSARGFAGQIEQPRADFQVSVTEALLFSNSDRVAKEFLRDSGDSLVGHLKKIEDDGQVIDQLFWSVHAREPAKEERELLLKYLGSRKDRRDAAIQQLVWSLLTSSELRFNY